MTPSREPGGAATEATRHEGMWDPGVIRHFHYGSRGRLATRLAFWARNGTHSVTFPEWIRTVSPWRAWTADGACHVLDLGCGDGSTSRELLRDLDARSHVLAVDLSETMVRAYASAGVARVRVAVCDARHLCVRDGSADVVLGIHLLHHLPVLDPFLRQCRRALGDRGRALFTLGEFRSERGLSAIHYRSVERLRFPREMYARPEEIRYQPGRVIRGLRRHFEVVDLLEYRNDAHCRDVAEVVEYYQSGMMYRHSMGPADPRIPGHAWKHLELRVRSAVADQIDRDGVFIEPGKVYLFVCRSRES